MKFIAERKLLYSIKGNNPNAPYRDRVVAQRNSPEESFAFILEVLKQTDDEWVLANLAAGPLEDILAIYPHQAIEWVEKETSQNPALKKILNGVWQNLMPDDVWQRLQKLMD